MEVPYIQVYNSFEIVKYYNDKYKTYKTSFILNLWIYLI